MDHLTINVAWLFNALAILSKIFEISNGKPVPATQLRQALVFAHYSSSDISLIFSVLSKERLRGVKMTQENVGGVPHYVLTRTVTLD